MLLPLPLQPVATAGDLRGKRNCFWRSAAVSRCWIWIIQSHGNLLLMNILRAQTGCNYLLSYMSYIRDNLSNICISATSFFLKNNWSLLPLCFTLSLGSAPFVSSSTSFWYQFLHFLLTYSFTHHFFLFDSPLLSFITLSLSPRLKTYLFHRFFWATPILFLVFPYFFCFCAVRSALD